LFGVKGYATEKYKYCQLLKSLHEEEGNLMLHDMHLMFFNIRAHQAKKKKDNEENSKLLN